MRKTHLEIIAQGVTTWNWWRREHPKTQPELIGANLRGADLTGVDLHGTDLRGAKLSKAYLLKADFSEANLREADLGESNLTEARLTKAYLFKVHLNAAVLTKADLSGAELFGADLTEADLREAKLNAAFLSRAALRGADLNRADLRGADLRGADLREANLSRADLSRADLSTADCSATNFNNALLNHAHLTGAVLCEIQRAGWSVFEVLCEYAFWGHQGRQRLNYALGEFERLYADRTRIALSYPKGLSAQEFATLPLLIQALQRDLPDYPLLLRNLEDSASGTTLTLEFEDETRIDPEKLVQLKEACEERGRELIAQQREGLGIPDRRTTIETHLEMIQETLFPQAQTAGEAEKEEEEETVAEAPAVEEPPPPFGEPN